MFLKIKDLSKHFGGLKAVEGVSFNIDMGTIHGLIGPNGSGKTTTLNMISGLLQPTRGSIKFQKKELVGLPMSDISKSGIARTFQQIRLFSELNAFQNVILGRHTIEREKWWEPILRPKKSEKLSKKVREEALEILKFVGLENVKDIVAKNLSYGNQRKLEIARALATNPELLLLDEPVAGMNPIESENIVKLLRKLNESGLTIILVEHSMNVIMNVTSHIVVLDSGQIIAEGKPQDIQNDAKVIEAYLGKRGGDERVRNKRS